MADELAEVADSVKWARRPGVNDLGLVAELANAVGYYSAEDLLDSTAAERDHIFTLLVEANGGGARPLRKISEAKIPPELLAKEQCSFQDVGISAGIKYEEHLGGFSDPLRPR